MASTLKTVLTDIQEQLIDDGVFQPDTLFLTMEADRQPKESPSTLYGTITPQTFRIRKGSQKGGGRVQYHKDGNIVVTVYSQLLTDPSHEDELLLTDSTLGLLTKSNEIQDSLEQFFPSSLRIPLKFLEEGPGTKQANSMWAAWRVVFEASYEESVT